MSGTLGFACTWGSNPQETWSGTPFRLRAALAGTGPVADVSASLGRPVELALKAASARRADGRWVSMWRHGALARRLTEQQLRRSARDAGCDAVITIQDLGIIPIPYLVLQDLSYDALLDHYGEAGVPHFPTLGLDAIKRLRDRQLRVYDQAAALLPMSHWLADRLVASGVDKSKIFPVHPGVNVPVDAGSPIPERRTGSARRLLFIGRDPQTKALDVVIAAVERLRREHGDAITITVAGPPVWPFDGVPPAGVNFLGPVSRAEVVRLLDTHDLFVMPSRLEGFGIAFVEALSRGLPCIGRRAFAMPEIIQPGTGGSLIDDDDPDQLTSVITSVLADDALYRRCADDALRIRDHYTWSRAAREVREAVAEVTS